MKPFKDMYDSRRVGGVVAVWLRGCRRELLLSEINEILPSISDNRLQTLLAVVIEYCEYRWREMRHLYL